MRRRRLLLASLAVAAGLPFTPVVAGAAEDHVFVVIVHADNPTEVLSRQETARMFLKQRARWDHGERVRPVDLSERWRVRKEFSLAIFRRRMLDIEDHWKGMVFSGRDVPPPEKGSVEEVLDYIAANPGGIGYVSRGTPLPWGVKPIEVVD